MPEVPETLLGLLRHYSPSGEEAVAVNWLVERMGALGYDRSYVDGAGNAVGEIGSGAREIVLLGHIDTVSGEIPVQIEGDALYGRGAVDAKGPLSAFVDAAARVGSVPGWKVIVIGARDEERDSLGARAVAPHYRPEYAIIGEPSRWERVTLGYKGSASAQVVVERPVFHSAGQVENACEAAFKGWRALNDWADTYNHDRARLFDQLQLSLRRFSSGGDGITDWARLHIGARLPVGFEPDDFYREIQLILGDAQVSPKGYPVAAFVAEKNTPLVRAFLAGIRKVGGKPGFVLKSGTADLNIVAPRWECPAVAYGPGDSSLDHTPNEHILISEYHRAVDVLEEVLNELRDAGEC